MKIKLIAGFVAVFIAGFLGGMEYKAYQIRSAMTDVFGNENNDTEDVQVVQGETTMKSDEAVNNLNGKVGFSITDKGYMKGDFEQYITFTFNLKNNTDKDITGVKGTVVLNDLFGDEIKTTRLSYDEGIKAGETKEYKVSLDYNQFIDGDVKLKSTELDKIKYDWDVNTIIYSDGTQEGS